MSHNPLFKTCETGNEYIKYNSKYSVFKRQFRDV